MAGDDRFGVTDEQLLLAAAMNQVDTICWRGVAVPVFSEGAAAFVRVADMPETMRTAMKRWHVRRGALAIAMPPCGGAYFAEDVRAALEKN